MNTTQRRSLRESFLVAFITLIFAFPKKNFFTKSGPYPNINLAGGRIDSVALSARCCTILYLDFHEA